MKSSRRFTSLSVTLLVVTAFFATHLVAGEPNPSAKAQREAKAAPLNALKAIEGTWNSVDKGDGGMSGSCTFKVTAGGSAVIETMLPGSKMEMTNAYHMDGDKLICTHYCAQGVQPRMKMVSNENGVIKFELLDVTNLATPDEPHMAGLELKIDGDTLTEKWSYKRDGKVEESLVIVMKKQA